MIQIGDKVKIIQEKTESDRTFHRKGQIHTVAEHIINNNEFEWQMECDLCLCTDQIEVITKQSFSIGDRVKITKCDIGSHTGETGKLIAIQDGRFHVNRDKSMDTESFCPAVEVELLRKQDEIFSFSFPNSFASLRPSIWFDEPKVSKRKKTMSNIAILAKKLLDADTKVLVKAGYLDDCLEVTEEGQELIFAHYVAAHKEELAKEARAKLKEEEKEN